MQDRLNHKCICDPRILVHFSFHCLIKFEHAVKNVYEKLSILPRTSVCTVGFFFSENEMVRL